MKMLARLPLEILCHIFILSQNLSLLFASKQLFRLLHNCQATIKTEWLLERYDHDIQLTFYEGVFWRFFDTRILEHLDAKWRLQQRNLTAKKLPFDKRTIPRRLFRISENPTTIALVETLLERGGSPNDDENFGYPLIKSSYVGNIKIAQLLLSYGADPLACNNVALHHSVRKGHIEVVKILLDTGANPDSKSVQIALTHKNYLIAQLLMSRGAVPPLDSLNSM